MHKTTQHLNDEHMRLYEWNAAGAGIRIPAKSKRTHPWHASYGVLAVLTSLLILGGCSGKATAEAPGEQDQAAADRQEDARPLYDRLHAQPAAAEAAAPATDGPGEPATESAAPAGEATQRL